MRVVCIDIEGGHGGSSRSLFHTLTRMDRTKVQPLVICRKDSWVRAEYEAAGIPCTIEPDMPRWTNLERLVPNVYTRAQFRMRVWPRAASFRRRLLDHLKDAELLHLNHISLADLAVWVKRRRPDLPITLHVRTMPVATAFAVRQTRRAASACDAFAFITENERDHFDSLLGGAASGRVIYNPVASDPPRTATADAGEPLRIICLSNYSYGRGLDRLIDVAAALSPAERDRIRFIVAGDMTLPRRLPAALDAAAPGASTLKDVARARGVADCFEFPGHIPDPERLLASGDVLIKPTRENNPWGRDILEGLAAGLPVVSVGTYHRFVETGETGLLQSRFDADGVARFLVRLADDRPLCRRMGGNAQRRVAALCAPKTVAEALRSLWQDTATATLEPALPRTRFAAVMPAFTAGGAERVLTSLVSSLPADRFQTRLFVLNETGALNADLSRIGFVHNLDTGRLRHAVVKLRRALALFHCEIVFTSQVHLNIGVLAIARLMPGIRVVVREANMPSACLASGHWPRWYGPLYRWALKRADRVVASSAQMAEEFRSRFGLPDEKIAVLYNPVEVDRIRDNGGSPRRHAGPGRRFVAVGRLVRQKGFDRLIDWMKDMPPEDRLEILGDGPERDALQCQIAHLDLGHRVILAGFSANPAPGIAGADALLMPSRWEGMPNAALEALALGTPVVATPESGAIREIAARAPTGAVTVTDAFPEAMMAIKPDSSARLRPSLLPDVFVADGVRAAFADLIQAVAAPGRASATPRKGD